MSSPLPESWLSQLDGKDASGWLAAFQAEPSAAVADLLWNRFFFGPLNPIDRGQLLSGWLELLGDGDGFASNLDIHLSDWVEKNWGKFERSGVTLASGWSCLAAVAEFSAKLPADSHLSKTAEALRQRFPERERFLASFSTAPASDPLGLYLAVIAEFQGDDRFLAGFWHYLCGLPDGVPFYHARYAMLGLRRLKAAEDWERGSLRAEVVLGLLRLAASFDRLVRERGLGEGTARATFRRVAAQVAAAYPDSPRWTEHGLTAVLEMSPRPKKWVTESVRPLAIAVRRDHAGDARRHPRPRRSIEPAGNWAERANELATALGRGQLVRMPDVESLLGEERRYAQATGNTYSIVRSLCRFALRIAKYRPSLAERWAEEARLWEPFNAFTWTTTKDILLKRVNLHGALQFAWVAWKRFPENDVTRNGLAEVLRAAKRYPEAEVIYRQTIELFPKDVVARAGLAEVVKAARRYPEAELIYRQTIELFPENIVARTGLADVLKAAKRYPEAEEVYRQTIELFPENVFARTGLADVLKATKQYPEAELIYRKTIELFPENIVARNGLADVLKATKQYPQAEEIYRKTIELFPDNVVARTGLAYLLLLQGRAGRSEALDLVEEVLKSDPKNPHAVLLKRKLELAQNVADETSADESDQLDEVFFPPLEAVSEEYASELAGEGTEGGVWSVKERGRFDTADARNAEEALAPSVQWTAPIEVSALLAEARFYRAWAARSATDAAVNHLQKAGELIARAEQLTPEDATVLSEKIALECAQGPLEAVRDRLTTEIGKHPGSATLLVLKARLDRDKARQTRQPLTDETLAELLQAPAHLRNLDYALAPMFHLDKGLAALALSDGNVRIEKAAEAFSSFRRNVSRRADAERADREASGDTRSKDMPRFHEWLKRTTDDRLFRGFQEPMSVNVEEVPLLEKSFIEKPYLFEEVEDVMVERLAFVSL